MSEKFDWSETDRVMAELSARLGKDADPEEPKPEEAAPVSEEAEAVFSPAPEEPEVPEEPVEKNPDLDGWEMPTDEDKPGKGGDQ